MESLPPSASSSGGLDFRVILRVAIVNFIPWLAVVVLATAAGYPGAVCVTPMAWLIALRVGIGVAERTSSVTTARRLQEGALAGALSGLLQGGLFSIMIPFAGPIQASERASALVINALVLGGGILVSAGLSTVMAWRIDRLRRGGA